MANIVKKEYSKKTAEVNDSVGNMRSEFDKRTGDVHDAANSLRQEAVRRYDEAHEQVDQSIDDSRKAVKDHPFTAVGIALSVGIIAGVLMRRRSKA